MQYTVCVHFMTLVELGESLLLQVVRNKAKLFVFFTTVV